MAVLAVVLLLVSCDHHFYKPLKGEFYHPSEFNLAVEEVFFQSPDGEKLHGWFIPSRKQPAKGTVLYLHGNSANMTNYLFYVAFLAEAGYHLMMFDYRGFGKSTGEPTAKGLIMDSQAALDYIRTRKEVDANHIIIFGQSLGGAVAVSMAGSTDKRGIKGVIVEAAFASYQQLAKKKMEDIVLLKWINGVAAKLFIDDQYAPIRFVQQVSPVPILIIHGTADRVVPFSDGEQLFKQALHPKAFWKIEEGRHIQMLSKYRSIYRPKLLAYLTALNNGAD